MLSVLIALAAALPAEAAPPNPLALHPENPRYFLFRGKPTVLITSGEHYGAVLNADFDYLPYLHELQSKSLNLTRLFSGAYREIAGSFNIQDNTLAPPPDRFLAPWPRSATPGANDGANKFDLTKWNAAYFRRLKDFCRQAGKRGIVVEVVLFCPFYEDSMWNVSPMNAANNVNSVGAMPRTEVYTLQHPDLLAVQDALTRKLVSELKDFDNIYYEICNEPYFGGVTLDWQRHIAATITQAEANSPTKHLIAQNIANGSEKITNPDPAVSIFNFHYASPPDAVTVNYALNKPIAFDETGFQGNADATYRAQAWDFLLAGGAVFDNLDYSFTASHPNGTFVYPSTQPGGGSAAFRSQLKILKKFFTAFDFIRMAPDNAVLQGGVPEGMTARVLAQSGKAYAVYLKSGTHATLTMDIPAGNYRADWVNPRTGDVDKTENITHPGGSLYLASPLYMEDIALRLIKRMKDKG